MVNDLCYICNLKVKNEECRCFEKDNKVCPATFVTYRQEGLHLQFSHGILYFWSL